MAGSYAYCLIQDLDSHHQITVLELLSRCRIYALFVVVTQLQVDDFLLTRIVI